MTRRSLFRRRGRDACRARRLTVETAEGWAQYVVAGSGPPVVLLHGLDGSARWWTPTIRALAPRYRCYALNFVAFDRWREQGRVPLARMERFVLAWLEALGLDWAHIVAHSMGAHAALGLSARWPERLGRLVLVAPAVLSAGRRPWLSEAGRLAPFIFSAAPAFLPVLFVDSLRTGPVRWLRAARELRTASTPEFTGVGVPTLLVWGTDDPLVPFAGAPLVQEQLPGSRLVAIDGARHVPMYERPAQCNDAIMRFLDGEAVGEPARGDDHCRG